MAPAARFLSVARCFADREEGKGVSGSEPARPTSNPVPGYSSGSIVTRIFLG